MRHDSLGVSPAGCGRHQQRHEARPEPLQRQSDAGPATGTPANGATKKNAT